VSTEEANTSAGFMGNGEGSIPDWLPSHFISLGRAKIIELMKLP